MTADETLSSEDDVTLAADSDVLAQIREEALALKRRRTAGAGKISDATDAADEVVVWSADNDSFDPSHDPTTALNNSPVPTVVPKIHGDESLIGNTPPPTSSASYFEDSETSTSVPEPVTYGPQSRPRVPLWVLLVLVTIVIIGLSVAIALLVASGSSA